MRVTSGPIGSSAEMDALADLLGIPPPEMAFPHNSLVLQHPESGFSLCFDAVRTLRSVEGVQAAHRLHGVDCRETPTSGKGGRLGAKPKAKAASSIKVAYAKEWGKSRTEFVASSSTGEEPSAVQGATGGSHFGSATADITAAKDYDWTYSTTWPGSVGDISPQPLLSTQSTPSCIPSNLRPLSSPSAPPSSNAPWFEPGTDPARDRIPVERLGASSGEPILFYDDIVLYEDELADNGSSIVNVKVRVMPSGFLVLQRFFLRVDDVVFRVFDTRLYCQFAPAPVPRSLRSSASPFAAPSSAVAAGGAARSAALSTSMAQLQLGAPRTSHTQNVDAVMSTSQDSEPEEDRFVARLIRECSGSSAPYSVVRSHLPPYKPHDLSPLTDVNWVTQTLTKISQSRVAAYHAHVASGAQPPRYGERDASAGAKYLSPTSSGAGAASGFATASSAGRAGRYVPAAPAAAAVGAVGGITGFPGTRPGEKMDLSPAHAPAAATGAHILGQIDDDDDESGLPGGGQDSTWQGCGARVDVAVLTPRQ